jgi:hypothetical protein
MKPRQRILTVLLLVLVVGLLPATAVAGGGAAEDTGSTPASAEPAVPVPPPGDETPEPPWTSRFLIPLLVVLSALLVGGLGLSYLVRVRNRYEVVRG